MSGPTPALSVDDHRRALIEVSFLLNIFATTVHAMMGGATAPVGRVAGRQAAEKLPVHLPEPTADAVLAAVQAHMRAAFDIDGRVEGSRVELAFGRCAIREACRAQGREAGGDLCRLFHFYLDGFFNGLLQRPTKSTVEPGADRCRTTIEIR
jgi:hypothetical protein